MVSERKLFDHNVFESISVLGVPIAYKSRCEVHLNLRLPGESVGRPTTAIDTWSYHVFPSRSYFNARKKYAEGASMSARVEA